MRLTAKDNPESLKRYAHVKPARGGGQPLCLQACPGTSRTCSREKGHHGPHVSHGTWGRVRAVWDGGAAAAARPVQARSTRRRRPVGLQTRGPGALRDFLRGLLSSLEEWVWLAFFVAFVGFAIGGFLLVFLG